MRSQNRAGRAIVVGIGLGIAAALAEAWPLWTTVALAADAAPQPASPEAAPAPGPSGPKSAAKPAESKPGGPAPPAENAPAGTSAVVLEPAAVRGLLGRNVRTAAGEDMGRLVDLLVAPDGQIRAAVLDFGGVLGVGSRKVAVDWKVLSFAEFAKDGPVQVSLTRNQIRVAPEYKANEPVVVLQATPEPVKKDSGPVTGEGREKTEQGGSGPAASPAPSKTGNAPSVDPKDASKPAAADGTK